MPLNDIKRYGSSPPPIVSTDFVDFATGQGLQKFYAVDLNGKDVLTSTAVYGTSGATFIAAGTNINKTFDMIIKRTLTIDGDGLCTFPLMASHTTGDTSTPWTYRAFLSKVTGGVDTVLASGAVVFSAFVIAADTSVHSRKTIYLDIPRTKFKVGDTMRLRISGSNVDAAPFAAALGHDPMNRSKTSIPVPLTVTNGDWVDSELYILAPIKLN